MIIDLRFNEGGWDVVSYKLAGRFVTEERTGHFKKTRKKGTADYGPLDEWIVKPTRKDKFLAPVVILTSDYTASAAEVFLFAMKDLPNITIVGDSTEGIFSDMYEFKLSNKWQVSLSHQKFYSSDMVNYEGKGIPPDIELLNTFSEIEKGQDVVLRKAVELLK